MADAALEKVLAEAHAKLEDGSGPSIQAAVEGLEHAARAGSGAAQRQLAGLRASGVSGPPDWDHSVAMLAHAAQLGDDGAYAELQLLASTTDALGVVELHKRVDIKALVAPRVTALVRSSPRIRVAAALFTPAECAWLIACARDRLKRATVYAESDTESRIVDARNNSEAAFRPSDLDVATTFLRARLANTVRAPLPFFEHASVLHYAVGQRFEPHHDFLDPALPGHAADLTRRGQRIATALVYLNDAFEGGETDFPVLGWKFRGGPGDLLVFDNVDQTGGVDRRTLHAGSPPTAGEKWLLSQWIRDRPPRPDPVSGRLPLLISGSKLRGRAMIDHGDAVEFRLCPTEAVGAVLMSVVLAVLVGGFGYYRGGTSGMVLGGLIGLVGVGLFGFHYFLSKVDRSVKLRIDTFGIHSAKFFVRSVAWSQISRIAFVRARRGTLKMKVFTDGSSNVNYFLNELVDVLKRGAINVEIEDLEGEPSDIVAAIQRFSPNTPMGL